MLIIDRPVQALMGIIGKWTEGVGISGISVTKGRISATNGRVLVQLDIDYDGPDALFTVHGPKLGAETSRRGAETIAVDFEAWSAGDYGPRALLSSRARAYVVTRLEGEFPDTVRVFPDPNDLLDPILLDLALLATLIAAMPADSGAVLRLNKDQLGPVQLVADLDSDNPTASALIMPMRMR